MLAKNTSPASAPCVVVAPTYRPVQTGRKKDKLCLIARCDAALWPNGEGWNMKPHYRNPKIHAFAAERGWPTLGERSINRFYSKQNKILVDRNYYSPFLECSDPVTSKINRPGFLAQYDDVIRAIVGAAPTMGPKKILAELRRRTGVEASCNALYKRLYALGLRKQAAPRTSKKCILEPHRNLIASLFSAYPDMTAYRLHLLLLQQGFSFALSTVYRNFDAFRPIAKEPVLLHVREITDDGSVVLGNYRHLRERVIPIVPHTCSAGRSFLA